MSRIVTVWSYKAEDGESIDAKAGYSGTSGGDPIEYFVREVEERGHAITTVGSKPWNHYVIGSGVGHQDAEFCESRGGHSMAAYYENGEAYGGRWWEDTDTPFSTGVKYYGCVDRWVHRSPKAPAARTPEAIRLAAVAS